MDEYSLNFDPHPRPLQAEKLSHLVGTSGPLPLDIMESSLYYDDPRNEKFTRHNISVDKLMAMIRSYLVTHPSRLFKNYYGFICVRHAIHITCLEVLHATGILEEVSIALPRSANWAEMSRDIAFAALDRAANALSIPESYRSLCRIFTKPGVFRHPNARQEIPHALSFIWDDRDSFTLLYSRGLLPGCALLLLASLTILRTNTSEVNSYRGGLLHLEDLAFRIYLVGSPRDRQVLAPVCVAPISENLLWRDDIKRFVNSSDTRVISTAYSGLLSLWEKDRSNSYKVPVDLMHQLAAFVRDMAEFDPSVTCNDLTDIAYTSLKFLWLIFDYGVTISEEDYPGIRRYAANRIWLIRTIQLERNPTQEEQYYLAQMLAEIDIISLVGRVMLLMSYKGNLLRNTQRIDMMLEELYLLTTTITRSIAVAPHLLLDWQFEWLKVQMHFVLLLEDICVDIDPASKTMLENMSRMWAHFGQSLSPDRNLPAYECANPRCYRKRTPGRLLRKNYVCGRCCNVSYCDQHCQGL
ncbi:hypothetical protein RhiJN_23181 [Ceratobasidium sp. AG-Ba]|nr:hypothetical protein RhiJN_23181 [Ceratobasidium sp. AG-Ba]